MRIRIAAFAIAGAAVLSAVAVPVTAQVMGHFRHGGNAAFPEHLLRMADALGLSEDQKSQIQTIIANTNGGPLGPDVTAMRSAKEALARTIHDPAATDDQVRDAAAAVAGLESDVAVQRHRMAIQIQAILTPDQKAKLDQLRTEFKERHCGGDSQ